MSSGDFDRRLDFNGCVAGEAGHRDSGPGVATGLAADVDQEGRRSVDNRQAFPGTNGCGRANRFPFISRKETERLRRRIGDLGQMSDDLRKATLTKRD